MNGDKQDRERATDPSISCILRAPAGSGKTTLLVCRYLRLLAQVDKPEEVLCVTFTVKATAEMKHRILEALRRAANDGQDEAAETQQQTAKQQTIEEDLARKVLQQDRRQGWQLLRSPQRLNVLTLDAFCASLVRSHPLAHLTSGQGDGLIAANYRIEQDASRYCTAAAQTLVREPLADTLSEQGRALMLRQLGGNADRLEQELAGLLAGRSDWLSLVNGIVDEAMLTSKWQECIRHWGEQLYSDIENLPQAGSEAIKEEILADDWTDANTWFKYSKLWLTGQGILRKVGHETPEIKAFCKDLREQMENSQQSHPGREHPAERLLQRLRAATVLAAESSEFDWFEPVKAFLLRAVGQLTLDMVEAGVADYPAVSIAADIALGNDSHITELALIMDYQLRHILVDEMQDLSPLQLQLLRKLVQGWQPDDGRTLMMVGDTTQSCYSFRGARPGEIARIAQRGQLEETQLEVLQLTRNFRAQPELVTFVNSIFAQAFPQQFDFNRGAEPYCSMESARPAAAAFAPDIRVHLWQVEKNKELDRREFRRCSRLAMAQQGIDFVQQAREEFEKAPGNIGSDDLPTDETTVAILVRNRAELAPMVEQLNKNGVEFSADATVLYGENEAVRTLVALARALRNPADRIAWLALLRSVLCGLSLADLHCLGCVGKDDDKTHSLWAAMDDQSRLAALSPEGKQRVERLVEVLRDVLHHSGRETQQQQLRRAWYGLRAAEIFVGDEPLVRETFAQIDGWQELEDWAEVEQRLLNQTYAPGTPGKRVRVMTIHAAKGLEFGAVLVPDMIYAGRTSASKPALYTEYWYESEEQLPLAQMRDFSQKDSGRFFTDLQKERERYESVRLSYVAMTRAIHRLCICGAWSGDTPPARSLMASLWQSQFLRDQTHRLSVSDYKNKLAELKISARVDAAEKPMVAKTTAAMSTHCADWQLEPVAEKTAAKQATEDGPSAYQLQGNRYRAQGTLVHSLLESVVERGPDDWRQRLTDDAEALRRLCHNRLRLDGVPGDQLDAAADEVLEGLRGALADERHGWIFQPGDGEDLLGGGEVALGHRPEGEHLVKKVQMDRSLLDNEGVRWIIDYKTARSRTDESEQDFVQRQTQQQTAGRDYGKQLAGYRDIVASIEPQRQLRCALYFPREQLLVEYKPSDSAGPNWAIL